MSRVVAVHGILNTYSTRPQMVGKWEPALLGGVELATGERDMLAPGDVEYVFFGDIYRPAGEFLDPGVPPFTADDVDDGLETELLVAWWKAAAAVDPGVVDPDAETLGTRATARAAIRALAGSHFLASISERLLVLWLKQVTAYFTQTEMRESIQATLARAIAADTRVVVAHSLGSVVAYEALYAHPKWHVNDLVTVGSPLAVPHLVAQRLNPPPQLIGDRLVGMWPGVERWVNISDEGDFVALQPRLRTMYGDRVTDLQITNGVRAHNVERYLSAAETGAAIVAGLREP